MLVPLLVLVSGWGFLTELKFVGGYFPTTAGIGSMSFLMMTAVYLVARCWREFGWFATWRSARLFMLLIPLFALTTIGFGKYASLVCIILAGVLFVLFSRLSIPGWLGSLAAFLGPTMFSVYIAHTNGIGFEWINRIETGLVGGHAVNLYLAYGITAIAIFSGCVLLDMPRRLLCRAVSRPSKAFCGIVDKAWDRLMAKSAQFFIARAEVKGKVERAERIDKLY